jgi:hypothetical protein
MGAHGVGARGRTGEAAGRACVSPRTVTPMTFKRSDDSRRSRASNYCSKKADCETLADRARNPHLTNLYLTLAIQWGELAEEAERRGW